MGKGKNATRRGARELAFQVLYGLSFTPAESPGELRRAFVLSPHNTAMSEEDLSAEPTGFAWELVEGVWSNSKALDAAIGHFSHNWRVDRMGRIELTLLRLAVFEMLYRQDVPPKVAINEALELSGQFGEGNAKNFINGILDAAAKALESGALVPPAARAANP
ncbi:transcription antitermination factor NusB [Desulfovibrio sp. PG-178-WT-4]|uniref:Transcription antitermination protein NusB n=1 Tax=Desulfovibrio porci TaxID=2605782 RepID=A0A6L5XHP8_9BACT|nr:transcription antitermination factor NusB [Desulfovibrio porci]MSS26696.1 transcription antitermination factor NusB [Desulfovibrio porci]